jgi:hypothetical protein
MGCNYRCFIYFARGAHRLILTRIILLTITYLLTLVYYSCVKSVWPLGTHSRDSVELTVAAHKDKCSCSQTGDKPRHHLIYFRRIGFRKVAAATPIRRPSFLKRFASCSRPGFFRPHSKLPRYETEQSKVKSPGARSPPSPKKPHYEEQNRLLKAYLFASGKGNHRQIDSCILLAHPFYETMPDHLFCLRSKALPWQLRPAILARRNSVRRKRPTIMINADKPASWKQVAASVEKQASGPRRPGPPKRFGAKDMLRTKVLTIEVGHAP